LPLLVTLLRPLFYRHNILRLYVLNFNLGIAHTPTRTVVVYTHRHTMFSCTPRQTQKRNVSNCYGPGRCNFPSSSSTMFYTCTNHSIRGVQWVVEAPLTSDFIFSFKQPVLPSLWPQVTMAKMQKTPLLLVSGKSSLLALPISFTRRPSQTLVSPTSISSLPEWTSRPPR